MNNQFFSKTIGLLLLSIAIVFSTYLITQTIKQIKLNSGVIYVKGCAEKIIQSDFVKWQGSIKVIANTQLAAYEKIEQDFKELIQYLQNEGINISQLEISPIDTSFIYQRNEQGHYTNTIENYELNQAFSIASSDVPLIMNVSQKVTNLLRKGLLIHSLPLQYFYLKMNSLKLMMLREAAKDAKQRAEELAYESGNKVGALHSAQQGIFQITSAYSNSTSDYGEFDTSSLSKKIKAVVTMEYSIN